jgi:hypothetical protein
MGRQPNDVHQHVHAWSVKNFVTGTSTWKFCECGWVWFKDDWRSLDQAWLIANEDSFWRKWMLRFLQRHGIIIREVPEELQHHIVRWATNTTCRDIPEDDFDMWLQDYWSVHVCNNRKTISIEIDDTPGVYRNPLTKEQRVFFDIRTVKTKAGWVGQITAEDEDNPDAEIYWESQPCDDLVDDDHKVVKTGNQVAAELALAKLNDVKKGLFA